MAGALWVAQLIISDLTAAKIRTKHGINPADVRQAVVGVVGLRYAWDYHPERGWRVLVEANIGGRACVIVLYEVEHQLGDVWALGSAYPR